MGGLGSHMVGLAQLRVLEIYYILTFTADGPVCMAHPDSPREGKSEVSLCEKTSLPAPSLT